MCIANGRKQAIHLAAADADGSRSNMGLIWQMPWQLPRHEAAAAPLFSWKLNLEPVSQAHPAAV